MARDVHGLRQDGNQVTEGQAASEARQVEVGSAFRVTELDHKAVDTRNQVIAATSLYLAKLYKAGHVTDNATVNFSQSWPNKMISCECVVCRVFGRSHLAARRRVHIVAGLSHAHGRQHEPACRRGPRDQNPSVPIQFSVEGGMTGA